MLPLIIIVLKVLLLLAILVGLYWFVIWALGKLGIVVTPAVRGWCAVVFAIIAILIIISYFSGSGHHVSIP